MLVLVLVPLLILLLLVRPKLESAKGAEAGSATDGMNASVPDTLCTWHTASGAAHGCMPCMVGSCGTRCLLLKVCSQLLHLLLLLLLSLLESCPPKAVMQ
jgi:hypothetical protein